ncbi:hypothetical protein BBJ28_00004784 [Nothophytophthora sp. Chile5]|nr:hypothetical protein BBJ28_00004784 [Nothophytophthora sp. Chile5]
MEDELIAQRDAAIAVTKELQRQLLHHRQEVERTFERRTLNAERLRLHAEEKLRRATEDKDWAVAACNRLLLLSLFCGLVGAIVGWIFGLLVFVAFGQPFAGFLMILPGMAVGTLLGLATKIQLESRRRDAKNQGALRHSEVEMAVSSGIADADAPLEPLEGVPGVEEWSASGPRHADSDRPEAAATAGSSSFGATSVLGMGLHAAWYTAQTSKDIALGLYHGKEYVQGVFQAPAAAEAKKQQ